MAQEEEAAQPLFAVLRGIADVIARLLTGATTPLTNFTKNTGKFALDTCKDVLKASAQGAVNAIKAGQNRSIGHGDYGLIKAGKFDRHMANDKFDMVDIQLNKKLDNKQKHALNKRLRKCGIRATLSGDNVLRCSEQHRSIVERYVKAIVSPAVGKQSVDQNQVKNSDNLQAPVQDEKAKHKGKDKESPAPKAKVKVKPPAPSAKSTKHKGKDKEPVALKKKGKHGAPKHRTNFATRAAANAALQAKPKTAAPKAKVKVKPPAPSAKSTKHKGKDKEPVALKKKGKHGAPKHRTNFATCAAANAALQAKPKTAAPKAKVKVKPPAPKLPLLKR